MPPVSTTRQTPAGIRLPTGFSTKLAFNRDADASFWESLEGGVGIPGVDGGDPIDISTMHQVAWRVMTARVLKTLTPFTVVAGFDPKIYGVSDMRENLVNQNGSVTSHFPDGSKLDYFAFLRGWDSPSNSESNMPVITLNVVPTNYDNVTRTEASPVLTEVTGT